MTKAVYLHSLCTVENITSSDTPSGTGAALLTNCLTRSGWPVETLDLVIACSNTPDFNQPGLVHCLLPKLPWSRSDLPQCSGLELKHLGAGSLYALQVGHDLIASGAMTRIAVVAVDFLSRFFAGVDEDRLNQYQRAAKNWFVDGGAACLLSAEPPASAASFRVDEITIQSDSRGREFFRCIAPQAKRAGDRLTLADLETGSCLPEVDLIRLRQFIPAEIGPAYAGAAQPLLELESGKSNFFGFGPGLEFGHVFLEGH